MDRNNETIRLAKKAADAWRSTDTYHQAAQIIDMLISALEGDPTLPPPNEPLTIEQLREMGGQPYWHVGLREESPPPHWNILDPFYAKHIEDYRYGENWLAYRRPPEGEEAT